MKYDVVIIGGGQSGSALGVELLQAGKKVCIISAGGFLGSPAMKFKYISMGGDSLNNARAVSCTMDGSKVVSVTTDNSITVEAEIFVLASGKFFSKGLVADMDKVYEPLFELDVSYEKDPEKWSSEDFYAPQPFESFGVKTTKEGKALKEGKEIDNLYACGEVLCGKANIVKSVERVCKNIR